MYIFTSFDKKLNLNQAEKIKKQINLLNNFIYGVIWLQTVFTYILKLLSLVDNSFMDTKSKTASGQH